MICHRLQSRGAEQKSLTLFRFLCAAFEPPTVADTKKQFSEAYARPIPAIYNTVVQELLVQQHFIRYSVNYKYNAVCVWIQRCGI